jgi:hypothetical protein
MNKPRETLNHQTRNVREMYLELQRLRGLVEQAEKRRVIVFAEDTPETGATPIHLSIIRHLSRPNRGRGRPPRDAQSRGSTHIAASRRTH